MKTIALLTLIAVTTAFSQGPLTPPGAPAPVMRTLSQIESRKPLGTPDTTTTSTIDITQPGSYVLTGPVAVASGTAISIKADFVTLDLNGFLISSTANPAAGIGVEVFGVRKHVTIKNGNIAGDVIHTAGTQGPGFYSGPGFQHGIYVVEAGTRLLRVMDVSVSGVAGHGIYAGFNTSIIERCSVDTVLSVGISGATVSNSNASGCGAGGIDSHCAVNCTGTSIGGAGVSGRVVSNCQGTSKDGTGIAASGVENSYGTSDFGAGITGTSVANSYGYSGVASGIHSSTVSNSKGISTGAFGIDAESVSASSGTSTNNSGIRSSSTGGSVGKSTNGHGISTTTAANSLGTSSKIDGFPQFAPHGVVAKTASHCYGENNGTDTPSVAESAAIKSDVSIGCVGNGGEKAKGILGTVVTSSFGKSSSAPGVSAIVVDSSHGSSEHQVGVFGWVIHNVWGQSGSNINAGIKTSYGAVTNSFGESRGTGIQAPLVIGSTALNITGAPAVIDSPSKHLGTP